MKIKSPQLIIEIHGALMKSGWELTKTIEEAFWFTECHWVFKSLRQSYGSKFFLTFMIDPDANDEKKIWSVMASTQQVKSWGDGADIAEFYLRKGHFENDLHKFISEINEYRNKKGDFLGK